MGGAAERWFLVRWYGRPGVLWLFFPLELFFRVAVLLRRALRSTVQPSIPLIIVGNITVGGSGKTPLVLWLAEALRAHGYAPGIISRGHGGRGPFPLCVQQDMSPDICGDEPLLLARRLGIPVVVGPDRRGALALLLKKNVNVVISDDGLQHYALARTVEIAVIDGGRLFGNGHCLPLGPLREPQSRLASVDFVVANGGLSDHDDKWNAVTMQLRPLIFRQVNQPEITLGLDTFATRYGRSVLAVAGLGNPTRFFNTLRESGFQVEEHAFPDHHIFLAADFSLLHGRGVLVMTEKDAVKCVDIAGADAWYLEVEAYLSDSFLPALLWRIGLSEEVQ